LYNLLAFNGTCSPSGMQQHCATMRQRRFGVNWKNILWTLIHNVKLQSEARTHRRNGRQHLELTRDDFKVLVFEHRGYKIQSEVI
jgi:predicted metal-dependent peptidase